MSNPNLTPAEGNLSLPKGKDSDLVTCPHCHQVIVTKVEKKLKSKFRILMPFWWLFDASYDYSHFCSLCHKLIVVDTTVVDKNLSLNVAGI